MKKSTIAFLVLLLWGCADNRTEEEKTIEQIVDSAKTKETILIKKSKKGIINDWIITDNFHSDTIVLNLLDSTTNKSSNVVTFNKNGSIDYWQYNPRPRCGNGIYYLDSISSWKYNKKNGNLILTLFGGVTVDCQFKKKIEYSADTTELDKLTLIKSRTYYNKERRKGIGIITLR